ncbi:guanine nucleotide binding protein, alpha subunit [Mycena albidolilacea]|uniref:Guanine nucleotide binding protein, alpha subunit n=1 Tax=Mycena albidolilacea TaxID=1033008 RepID=A0AAD7A5E3_9AGAR|nr:guanine nucleotide binding protein, alpha subunit [Mycena albidolilacea]
MDPPKRPGSSTQWALRIPLVNAVKRLVFLTKRWGRRQIFDKFKGGKDKLSSDRAIDKISTAKILLLGAADSGKSTILKQMRMKYNVSFSSSEIEAYRRLAFDNVIQGMRLLLASLPSLGLNLPDALRPAEELLNAATDLCHDAPFPADFSDAITALWNHSTVQEARRRGREIALQENLPYLYTNLSRFFSPSFIPSHRDILHLHERTVGTTETRLIVNGIDTLVVDVGGAISERRKWIDAFADLTVIIYTVSLTGYSRFLVEDPCRNQMQDSLLIWDSICNAGWFRRIPIILCFTKNDLFEQEIQHYVANWFPDFQATPGDAAARRDFFLFEEEIQHSDVANWFRGFQAAPGDTAAGRDYFINRFLALVKIGRRVLDEDLYIRVITATDADAETMKEVLDLAEGMYCRVGCTSKQGCNTEVINGPNGLR